MKTETIEEFLNRGGKIEKGQYIEPKRKNTVPVKSSNNIGSMSDFSDLFGSTPKKIKQPNSINTSLISESLLQKLREMGHKV